MKPAKRTPPLTFFGLLTWLDGRPLLDTIEPYRRRIFEQGLYTFEPDGSPRFNLVLAGRAKKNWKSADLILAALYRFLAWPSLHGNDAYLVANDEGQAGDDLALATKLVQANPVLKDEVRIRDKWIERRDGLGTLRILPARDVLGMHGKTYLFAGFDEIHGYRNWDVLEALAPDPTRADALCWITSYASLFHRAGVPLHDLLKRGQADDDPRMFFSWYAGDFTTDPALADDATAPEERANPSMASWGNPGYLAQQRRRLPTHKYRRLHLNLQGAPEGAFFDPDMVARAVVTGRRHLKPEQGVRYSAFVDMSGGSSDDATLAIAHLKEERTVVDLVEKQAGRPPFNPRKAVEKFAEILTAWGISTVTGDAYAGQTFRVDFEERSITYDVASKTASELYEDFEPRLNAEEVELLDDPRVTEQLVGLVVRGGKVTHLSGEHDDFANAVAGATDVARADRLCLEGIQMTYITSGQNPAQGIW